MRNRMDDVNNILIKQLGKNYFSLDHETLTTLQIGYLTPFTLIETAPGDKFNIAGEALARLAPLAHPIMHKLQVKIHYWYVPNRIVWAGFEHHVFGNKDPLTGLKPVPPSFKRSYVGWDVNENGHTNPRMAGLYGVLPPFDANNPAYEDIALNPMPFAAYQAIWNDHYRHKGVTEEFNYQLEDGEMTTQRFNELCTMRRITFQDDYFNTSLPTPQAGEPVFIDTDAPVRRNIAGGGSTLLDAANAQSDLYIDHATPTNARNGVQDEELYAIVQLTVEEERRARLLQKFAEADNHSHNYKDGLKIHHNVDFPDYRANQAQFIGGSNFPVVVSDVMNTADQNQGRLTGNGAAYGEASKADFYCHEHGMIIGIAVVTYDPKYMDALPRFFTHMGRFDYRQPMLDGMGEQAVKTIEIAAQTARPNKTFGYNMQNWHLMQSFDTIRGEFRKRYADWHFGRSLTDQPTLTSDFFEVVDERRPFIYRGRDADPVMLQVYNNIGVSRSLAEISDPIL